MSDATGAAHSSLRCFVALLAVSLLVVTLVGLAVGGAVAADSDVADDSGADTPEGVAANTTILIELQSDGDARWTVTEHVEFDAQWERDEFESLAEEFQAEDADGATLGLDAFVTASELVDAETDREMEIAGVERDATADDDGGELVLSFDWENFARVDGDSLLLDDVYETEQGLWFDRLTEHQTLVIDSPDGYGFRGASVGVQDGQLVWEGPQTFTNQTLQATLVGNGGADNGENGNGDDQGPVEPPNGSDASLGWLAAVIALGGVAAVVVIAAFALGRGTLGAVLASEDDEEDDAGAELAAESDGEQADSADEDEAAELELLSDEERVERLLEQRGGRMKQAQIVKETDWSNAKVSQLLSSMENEGRIHKLRIGRENLISFPEENVTEIDDE